MSGKRDTRIQLAHGGGGQRTLELVRDLFVRHLGNPVLDVLDDSAVVPSRPGALAMSTDAFVVRPLVFPGGDIGSLAIRGTVNDLAVAGAVPSHLSLAAVLEEGLELDVLETIVRSAATAAREAGVQVVTGDTKVVEQGKGDGAFLITSGVGWLRAEMNRDVPAPASGDAVLVSGPVGDHGAVILALQAGLDPGSLESDCAAVTPLVDSLFAAGVVPRFMRDPTRGGLAGVLCDLAEDGACEVEVAEAALPVRPAVRAVCDIGGYDPLHLACEGRVVAVVAADEADAALETWRGLPAGEAAAVVGRLADGAAGRVVVRTALGGLRTLLRPSGELLPRIC